MPLGGYGYPTKKIGLIHSMFRPSDDATVFSFNIPGNIFASRALFWLAELDITFEKECMKLSQSILSTVYENAVIQDRQYGKIYAYEINGFGSFSLMDDANIPSLLSLSYLTGTEGPIKNTRQFTLSESNPFFFKGKAAEGIGGPHVGMDYIWPMSIIMRGLTSTDDKEIKICLDMLQKTHAGTGFMHESFHKDDATKFTRKWFAWANTIFGEFVWKIYRERRHLLN